MKAIITIIMSMLLLAGLTTSCSNDVEEAAAQSEAYLKIDAMVNSMTRGAIDATNFAKGDAIGVFVRDLEGKDYNAATNCSNIKATYDGSKWTLASKVPLTSGKEAVVYAYYPYNANAVVNGDSIDIDITKQEDVMYGNATGVTVNNSTAKITFNHALARLSLSITKSETDFGIGEISKVEICNGPIWIRDHNGIIPNGGTSTCVGTKGKMNLKDGGTRRTDYNTSIVINSNSLLSQQENVIIDVLLFEYRTEPTGQIIISTRPTQSVDVILTIDGQKYKFNTKQSISAGKQCIFPLNVDRILSINYEGVNMGIRGDNGKEVFYWGKCDLGATSPEKSGGLFGWGDPSGIHTEQWVLSSYGNYKSYSDCIGCYGGLGPSNISGDEKYDVVKSKLGGCWRMPSKKEWENLIANTKRYTETINGIKGTWFESKINRNKIFIPLVEYERIGKTFQESRGYYWTSNIYSGETAYAIKMSNIFEDYAVKKCYGFSIRPVYEATMKELIYDMNNGQIK